MLIKSRFAIAIGLTLLMLSACSTQTPPATHQQESRSVSQPQRPLTLAQQNLIKSQQWLADNLLRDGVRQTASGLQYKVLKSSDGCQPDVNKPVTLHYNMRLASDNQVLDSSYNRGSPGVFNLHNMIPGWLEGVALMKTGEIWEFYLPPELAYGEKGSGPKIEPNVVMIFKIELVTAYQCM
jgi:FKBP-type peptidyl-prolyl cis-trans isomerase